MHFSVWWHSLVNLLSYIWTWNADLHEWSSWTETLNSINSISDVVDLLSSGGWYISQTTYASLRFSLFQHFHIQNSVVEKSMYKHVCIYVILDYYLCIDDKVWGVYKLQYYTLYTSISLFLTTVKLSVSSRKEHHWPSRRQSWLAGDDEGIQRLLTLSSLQRPARRQNLTGSQFMIESVEHLQNVGFPYAKTEQMWPLRESSYRRPDKKLI